MRAGHWVGAACVALAVAIVPGALRLVPAPNDGPVERPLAAALERVDAAPPPTVADEVAITPLEELTGTLAEPSAPAPTFDAAEATTADGQVFALLVGIDDYPGRRSDLRSAVADVDTIDAALDGFGVPASNRVVLRDGQARLADVVTAARSLVAQGGPGATYVFGYAGHVRKLDLDTEALVLADGQTLSDVELAALLAPATTQRMWLLLATCYAGGFTELLGPNRVLTGAADANSLAYESTRLNASYLVYYLVRQAWLEGAAGPSVQDAFAYADASLARDLPNRRPIQIDEAGIPLVLGAGDPSAGQPKPTPTAPSPAPVPPPSPTTTTTTPPSTTPPKDDDCLLGLLC